MKARADTARDLGDTYVAVPIALAAACAELRECGARFVMTHDEDGPLPTWQEIQCRKPENHDHDHYNGYLAWSDAAAEMQRKRLAGATLTGGSAVKDDHATGC